MVQAVVFAGGLLLLTFQYITLRQQAGLNEAPNKPDFGEVCKEGASPGGLHVYSDFAACWLVGEGASFG